MKRSIGASILLLSCMHLMAQSSTIEQQAPVIERIEMKIAQERYPELLQKKEDAESRVKYAMIVLAFGLLLEVGGKRTLANLFFYGGFLGTLTFGCQAEDAYKKLEEYKKLLNKENTDISQEVKS